MRGDITGKIAVDLLSIPHLIFRIVRKKVLMASLSDLDKDIKFPHIEILTVLKEEGTLHITGICDRLQIAKAQMTHYIDKLVELDLVERNTDAADRRTYNISLTEKGSVFLENRTRDVVNSVIEYMSNLTDEEVEALSNSLNSLRDTLLKLQ